jgi:hypothetical protein
VLDQYGLSRAAADHDAWVITPSGQRFAGAAAVTRVLAALGKLHADKAYDSAEKRRALRRRGIVPQIARRGVESSGRLGRYRWIVERSLAGRLGCRRLGDHYERHANPLRGLPHLA